jgi:tetratricopeptide (TPR) repeat protein
MSCQTQIDRRQCVDYGLLWAIAARCHLVCLLLLLLGFVCLPANAQGQASKASKVPSPSFDELALYAEDAQTQGRFDDAATAYKKALRLRPNWDEGWWYLGTLNYDADRYSDAIPAFQKVTELKPDSGAAWGFLGLCEFQIKNYKSAFVHLEKAQSLGFHDTPEVEQVAAYHLALLHNLRGEFEQSRALLIAHFGQHSIPEQLYPLLGMTLLRVPLLPDQVDPSKEALIHAAGNVAASLLRGDAAGASQGFEQLIKDYPETPYARYSYAEMLAAGGRYEDAERLLTEEAKVNPQSALVQERLAWVALQTTDVETALTSAQRAVKVAPQSAEAHKALAAAEKAEGKPALAQIEETAANRLPASPAAVDTKLAQTYKRTVSSSSASGKPDSSRTSAQFDEAAGKAAAAQKSGDLQGAQENYERGVKIRPAWEEGWRQLGTVYYMQARYPDAIKAFKNAVALDASHPEVWTVLGLSEYETADYKNALIHLERGKEMGFGGNAAAIKFATYHLALLLNLQGRFDQATDLLIPQVGPGPMSDQINGVLGLAILRMPVVLSQVEDSKKALVVEAGQAAALLAKSKYDEAFPMFDAMLAKYPNTPYLHYAYGDALAYISRYDEAETQLREEIKVTPDSPLSYTRLASVLLTLHRPGEALGAAQNAVRLKPDSADSYYMMGRAELELGNTDAAITALEQARKLAPTSPGVHFNLAKAYAKAKRPEDADRERAAFERLNAQVQKTLSADNDVYGGSHDRSTTVPQESKAPASTPK